MASVCSNEDVVVFRGRRAVVSPSGTPNLSRTTETELDRVPPKNVQQDPMQLLELAKKVVMQFRLQSAQHFAHEIEPTLSDPGTSKKKAVIRIVDLNDLTVRDLHWPSVEKVKNGKVTQKVMVWLPKRRYPMPLEKALAMRFPASAAFVTTRNVMEFWDANGKSFNWSRVPTELKENVLNNCINNIPPYPDRFHGYNVWRKTRHQRIQPLQYSCEVYERLGPWVCLLWADMETRAITLNLIFNGCSTFEYGLCLTTHSIPNFLTRMNKLEHYSLICDHGTVPSRDDSAMQARGANLLKYGYRKEPKLYPELAPMGTFLQGVRKVDLGFDLMEFYRFFKLTRGEDAINPMFRFPWAERKPMTYDVLEKMPRLDTIVLRFPRNREQHWRNKPYQHERPLFHMFQPCLRSIFRVLYERIAEAFAGFEDFTVKNFLDKPEEQRYLDLRKAAIEALQEAKLAATNDETAAQEETPQVAEDEIKRVDSPLAEQADGELGHWEPDPEPEWFYPVRCECEVQCCERYEFWPEWLGHP